MNVEWSRVNRQRPCAICDHGDWCTYSSIGSCCMRVESSRPLRNGGWLHITARSSKVEQPVYNRQVVGSTPTAPIDFSGLINRWRREKAGELESFAATLGVGKQDLVDLHTCWSPDHRAFAFPMYDAQGNVTGIRLRKDQFKWSVKGSHSGLFIPYSAMRRVSLDYLLLTEGPTDTASALTIGFFAIGRPSCLGCERLIVEVLNELSVKNIIMCVDNDEPGIRGANKLRKMIPYQFKVSKFVPPTKDLRDFVSHGGTRELLLSVVKQATRA